MIYAAGDVGPFEDVVSGTVAAAATVAAIGLTWRHRAKWEPAEVDLDKGPERVSGVICAVFIAAIWISFHHSVSPEAVVQYAFAAAAICLIFLLLYIYMIGVHLYDKEVAIKGSRKLTTTIKVIGGFQLTPAAAKVQRREAISIQRLFRGCGYDPDEVWTRWSRSLAKAIFVACYIALTVSGTVAMACVGLIVSGIGAK